MSTSSLSSSPPLPCDTPERRGLLEASKWLEVAVLLSAEELLALWGYLESPFYYLMGSLHPVESFAGHVDALMAHYRHYVEELSSGSLPNERDNYALFNGAISSTQEGLYLHQVAPEKALLRMTQPVIQLQYHKFFCSLHDDKIHSMSFGPQTISWGLHLSFPQLYKESKRGQLSSAYQGVDGGNSQLFRNLMQWLRRHSLPVSFAREGRRLRCSSSLRLGKQALPWISRLPQLAALQLTIE